jgi:hypothetical protein
MRTGRGDQREIITRCDRPDVTIAILIFANTDPSAASLPRDGAPPARLPAC